MEKEDTTFRCKMYGVSDSAMGKRTSVMAGGVTVLYTEIKESLVEPSARGRERLN